MNATHLPTSEPVSSLQFELLESLLDRLAVGIAIIDQDLILRHYNATWLNLIQRNIPLSTHQKEFDISLVELIPEAAETLTPLIKRVISGETIRQKTVCLEGAQHLFYLNLTSTLVENDVLILATDATKQTLAYQDLENRAGKYVHDLDVLIEISRNLVSLEQETFLSRVLDQLKTVVDYTGAAIWMWEDNTFTPVVYRGPISQEKILNLTAPLIGPDASRELIQKRESVIVSNTQDDTLLARAFRNWVNEHLGDAAGFINSWVGIPLIVKDRVVGLFALQHSRPNYYTPEQRKLAQTFADYVAVALENDRLYKQAANVAALQERNRLARELHDNTAQALGYMNLKISMTNELLLNQQIEEAQANLQELKQLINDTYTDIREEIFSLRATTSLDLGFLDTLREYIKKYNKYYDLDIQLIIDPTDASTIKFNAEVGGQIIRVIQESLINVRKHAQVNTVIIRVSQQNNYACIQVQDKGLGFDLRQLNQSNISGFGLQIMRERAKSIGGSLEINSTPGQGVEIVIWVPMGSGVSQSSQHHL